MMDWLKPNTEASPNESDRPFLSLLQSDFNTGGVQKIFATVANALVDRGNSVEVVVYQNEGPWRHQLDPRITIWELRRSTAVAGRLTALRAAPLLLPHLVRPILFAPRESATLRYLPSLVSYLRQRRPATMLAATTYINIEAMLARRLAKSLVRLTVSERTFLSQSMLSASEPKNSRWHRRHIGPLVKWAYNNADSIIAVSQGVADDLINTFGVSKEKIKIVYNPVIGHDFADRLNEPVKHPWANDKSVPVLLFVGRLTREKGILTLLKAFSIVLKSRSARLLLVGGSADPATFAKQKGWIISLADQLAVTEHMDLVGFEPNPLPYMRVCSVFVLPSRHEGFGNVLVEALAAGAPVVSTDCPSGPSEILDRGRFGSLVPVDNAEALAAAIVRAIESPHNAAAQMEWTRRFSYAQGITRYAEVLFGENTEAC